MSLSVYRKKYKKHIREHFVDLQKWMRFCFGAWILFSVFIYFHKTCLVQLVLRSLVKNKVPFVFSGISDSFVVSINISLFFGFVCCLPFVVWSFYSYLCPLFKKHDRLFFRKILTLSVIFFMFGGVCFAEFILSGGVSFFVEHGKLLDVQNLIDAKQYISSFMFYSLCFGLLFQFPVIILIGLYYKFFDVLSLKKFRRIFIFSSILISGIVTPPDVLSQLICSLIMIVVYELIIFLNATRKK